MGYKRVMDDRPFRFQREFDLELSTSVTAHDAESAIQQAAEYHRVDPSAIRVRHSEPIFKRRFNPETEPGVVVDYTPQQEVFGELHPVHPDGKIRFTLPFRYALDYDGLLKYRAKDLVDTTDPHRGEIEADTRLIENPYAPKLAQKFPFGKMEISRFTNLPDGLTPTDFYRGETISGEDPTEKLHEATSRREALEQKYSLIDPDVRDIESVEDDIPTIARMP